MASYNAPTTVGEVLNLPFTGTIDSITIQQDGLYKLLAWGACGGYYTNEQRIDGLNRPNRSDQAYSTPGPGGRTCYHIELFKGDVIYACIGGTGGLVIVTWIDDDHTYQTYYPSSGRGFNGGGYHTAQTPGGGATHFATISGTLTQIGSSKKSAILCVAGGGGSAGAAGGTGGYGGGNSGGTGANPYSNYGIGYGTGGTQTAGGYCPWSSNYAVGSFGTGGDGAVWGGGGLYGGGGGANHNGGSPSGGGSGYIRSSTTLYKGVTYTNYTYRYGESGDSDFIFCQRPPTVSSHGKASVELVKKAGPSVILDGEVLSEVIYDGVTISDIILVEEQESTLGL